MQNNYVGSHNDFGQTNGSTPTGAGVAQARLAPVDGSQAGSWWSWHLDSVVLRISGHALHRIQGQYAQAQGNDERIERGAVLTGWIEPCVGGLCTTITDLEPCGGGRLEQALAYGKARRLSESACDPAGGSSQSVGYVRTAGRTRQSYDEADRRLVEACFSEAGNVALIGVAESAGTVVCDVAIVMETEIRHEQIRWIAEAQRNQPPIARHPDAFGGNIGNAKAPTMPATQEARAQHRLPAWPFSGSATLVALMILLVGMGLVWRLRPVLSTTFGVPPVTESAPSELTLSVTKIGSSLQLNWPRHLTLFNDARIGVLTIEDGQYRKETPLQLDALKAGAASYTPTSDLVQFQLEVYGRSGGVQSASIVAVSRGSSVATDPNWTFTDPIRTEASPVLPSLNSNAYVPRPREQGATRASAQPVPASVRDGDLNAGHADERPIRQFRPPEPDAGKRQVDPIAIPDPPAALAAASVSAPELHISNTVPGPPKVQPAPPAEQPRNRMQRVSTTAPPLYIPASASFRPNPRLDSMTRKLLSRDVVVELKLMLDEQGRVVATDILRSAGKPLEGVDRAAVAAARQWRFEPARYNGKPVPSDHLIDFRFLREPPR